ncbi:MAG: TolC family protein [Desulfobacteraceae bacterium]
MIRKLFLVCCCLAMMVQAAWGTDRVDADNRAFHQDLSSLTLFQCIEIALEQNQKQRISKLAVDTAGYQHKQALSSLWPHLTFEAAYNQQDEDTTFIFPENSYVYDIALPGLGTITGQTTVPEQHVTVMDRESVLSSLNMTFPLFTGGLRSGAIEAAQSNTLAAKQALRRTELELVRDVQRMYYGVVVARRLSDIGEETLARLKTTSELTERLYKAGSGSVTKLDYLRSGVVLESARAIVERLTSNVALSKAALGNTIGLDWDTAFEISETAIPLVAMDADLNKLVDGAYRFNPDWKRLAAGLEAAEALVKKEQSGYMPKVALTGSLWRWNNNLDDAGLSTEENEAGWRVGLGLQMPIFTGFMTTNKIKEAKARLKKLESQQILLKKGLALQVKHGVIRVDRSQKIRRACAKAADNARQHCELAVRAYMNELVSTQVVIESQIFEALARAKSEMAQFENAVARFDIDFIVGRKVQKLLGDDR